MKIKLFVLLIIIFSLPILRAKDIEIGIKGGVSYNKFFGENTANLFGNGGEFNQKIGFNFGGVFIWNISENFSLQSEINYSKLNFSTFTIFKIHIDTFKINSIDKNNFNENLIEIPIFLRYKVNLLEGNIGFYLGIDINFKLNDNSTTTTEYSGQSRTYINNSLKSNFTNINFGLNYDFSKILIDLRYKFGLTNMWDIHYDNPNSICNCPPQDLIYNSMQFSIGYILY